MNKHLVKGAVEQAA